MQIGLVDRLRGVRFFWWIGNIGVKGAKKFKKCVGRNNSDSDELVR